MSANFQRAADVVARGQRDRAYPAAVVEVGNATGVLWRQAFGRLDYEPESAAAQDDTIFDLASLTKVLATTTVAMQLVEAGRIALSDPIVRWIPEWRGHDREHVTLSALLTHSSGLTAWLPLYRDYTGRRDFQHAICSLPLEYAPDSQSVYSDLGFMLLAFALEDAGGASFESQSTTLLRRITPEPLLFNPPGVLRPRIAPTESDPWRGRILAGEVHDENCWALGGAAGHAGLFGTAQAVGDFARAMLKALRGEVSNVASRDTVRLVVTRSQIPGSRALGWDTMRPTSSCGVRLSPTAFGHTGFTGTSLWIDPERETYVILLTNRVNPTRENRAIQQIRPALHDAVVEILSGG
jgi:CubicO group peptidase (beta-lactamase class C family)